MGTNRLTTRSGCGCLVSDETLLSCFVKPDDAVVVGLSGGSDSVALLYALCGAVERGRMKRVCACHVHHGIRGAAADADEAFCRALCERLCVPFTVHRADVPKAAKAACVSLETAARELRYAALERARCDFGAQWIAVAHHALDQAETVLMHLMRGAGLDGLAGMRPVNGRVIRPLLMVSKAEITAFLIDNGLDFCTDETNALPCAARNRVRLELLPLMEELRPGAAHAIAACSFRLASDAAYLNAEAEKALSHAVCPGGYTADKLIGLADPLKSRALLKILALEGVSDGSAADVARLSKLLGKGASGSEELRNGFCAVTERGTLRIERVKQKELFSVPFRFDGETRFPGGSFLAETVNAACLPARPDECYLDADCLPQSLFVRTRENGDRFYPLGAPGERLLSDCFTDRKLTGKEKLVPLLAAGSRVYWTPGYTVSELAKVTPSTARILHILYKEGT